MTIKLPILGKPLAVAAAGVVVVAVSGGLATDIGPWYRALEKPWFQPPDWLFGPAWTLIFALIALAAAEMWQSVVDEGSRKRVVWAFSLNGALNVLWSVLFFTLKRPDYALAEVVLLWLSIAGLMWMARPISGQALWLLIPYLAWVSFAAALNLAVVRLNAPF